MINGIIALDIDGTLTADIHHLPPEVLRYLEQLADRGWVISLVTGRPFSLAERALAPLSFPYHLAVHNGAMIFEMPERKMVANLGLENTIFPALEKITEGEPTDFVVYSGFLNQDACYYRPHFFSGDLLAYVERRAVLCKENWLPVASFEEVSFRGFPAVKFFGLIDSLKRITCRLEEELGLHVPIIRDPFGEEMYIAQATNKNGSKGGAVESLRRIFGITYPVIAAGDDNNDLSLLQAADIKIAMATAPQALKETADIIAPSAEEMGIIKGLGQAIARLERAGT